MTRRAPILLLIGAVTAACAAPESQRHEAPADKRSPDKIGKPNPEGEPAVAEGKGAAPVARAEHPLAAPSPASLATIESTILKTTHPHKVDVAAVAERHEDEVRGCYDIVLAYDSTQSEEVEIQFSIDEAGKVPVATVARSKLPQKHAAQCIASAVKRWSFPPSVTGRDVVATQAFKLTPPAKQSPPPVGFSLATAIANGPGLGRLAGPFQSSDALCDLAFRWEQVGGDATPLSGASQCKTLASGAVEAGPFRAYKVLMARLTTTDDAPETWGPAMALAVQTSAGWFLAPNLGQPAWDTTLEAATQRVELGPDGRHVLEVSLSKPAGEASESRASFMLCGLDTSNRPRCTSRIPRELPIRNGTIALRAELPGDGTLTLAVADEAQKKKHDLSSWKLLNKHRLDFR